MNPKELKQAKQASQRHGNDASIHCTLLRACMTHRTGVNAILPRWLGLLVAASDCFQY